MNYYSILLTLIQIYMFTRQLIQSIISKHSVINTTKKQLLKDLRKAVSNPPTSKTTTETPTSSVSPDFRSYNKTTVYPPKYNMKMTKPTKIDYIDLRDHVDRY